MSYLDDFNHNRQPSNYVYRERAINFFGGQKRNVKIHLLSNLACSSSHRVETQEHITNGGRVTVQKTKSIVCKQNYNRSAARCAMK